MRSGAKVVLAVAALALLVCVASTFYAFDALDGYTFNFDNDSLSIGPFTAFQKLGAGVVVFCVAVIVVLIALTGVVIGLIGTALGLACALLAGAAALAIVLSPLILLGVLFWLAFRTRREPPTPVQPSMQPPMAAG